LGREFERGDERTRCRLGLSHIWPLFSPLALCLKSCSPWCRLFLSEFFNVLDYSQGQGVRQTSSFYPSDLFGDIYVEELTCLLAVAFRHLPSLITLEGIVRVLLRSDIGLDLLHNFVANTPEVYHDAAKTLVTLFKSQPDTAKRRVGESIIRLSHLAPHHSFFLRGLLMKEQIVPQVMLQLTLSHCHDEVFFMNLLFEAPSDWLDSDRAVRPLVESIRKKIVGDMQDQLVTLACHLPPPSLTLSLSPQTETTGSKAIDECTLMRLYCGFAGYLHLTSESEKIESEEREIYLYVMKTSTNPRVLTIGLCYLLLYPGLRDTIGKNEIVNTLLRVKERAMNEKSESGTDTEMLLLLAIYFHTQQPVSKVTNLVVDTLNINLKLSKNQFLFPLLFQATLIENLLSLSFYGLDEVTLAEIKEIFTKEVFQERLLAEFVISLPPSKDLEATTRAIPLTCVLGLLQGRLFQKHKLDVNPWIQRQVFATGDSIHPLMPTLIQEFVRAMVVEGCPDISRIPDQTLIQAFSGFQEKLTVAQILLAFYVLTFNSLTQSQRMKAFTSIVEYPLEVLDAIPFKKIMRQIERREAYINIAPLLLSLTVTQLPNLFGTQATILEEDRAEVEGAKAGSTLEGKLKSMQLVSWLSQSDTGTTWPPTPGTIESLLRQSLDNPPIGLMGT